MSLVKVSGNASGTGTLTIAAPNTNSDYTLTLPTGTGTFNISGVVNEVPAGTVSAPSIYPTGDTNTGIFFPAADTIAFTEGGVESMRIDTSGNLLVGTTSSGGVGFTVAFDGAGRILTSNVSAVPFDVYLFKNSGTTVGKITINTASTAYTTTSDYRLKENITPLAGALSVINQLKPVNFTWKLSGESTQGFIAHELQAVVPDCVVGDKDAVDAKGSPVYQGVDTSFLVATLTAAIQELTARITALENK